MSECTNRNIAKLMHGYEIGILPEQESVQFEAHLLECEHCFTRWNRFEQQASLLTTSRSVKAVIDEMSSEEDNAKSSASRLWRLLWPKVPFVFRPAIAYLLILILAIPAYQGLKDTGKPTVREFRQAIHLSPTRTSAKALKKGTGDNGLVTFRFEGYRSNRTYQIVVESEDGLVAYRNDEFGSFDEREIGSLNLMISEMKPGKYRLIISDSWPDSASLSRQYWFWIEE